MFASPKFNFKKGFTLIEVLIGIFLILIVFLGIYGLYQLSLKVINTSASKITATYIANQCLEKIKNLPYGSIGIEGGFPDGVLESSTTTTRNNYEYTIETRVDFVVDSTDGIVFPDDDCPNDYKRVEVKVSWEGMFEDYVSLATDISPENMTQECQNLGGILSVSVFDAFGEMVPSPLIEIKDVATGEVLKSASPDDGKHYFSLATSSYKVVVSKSSYSIEQTYDSGDTYGGEVILTPEKPHPIVLQDQLTEVSFSIDKISSFSIDTLSSWSQEIFSDSFLDESEVSELSDVVVTNGEATLATNTEGYLPLGYLMSTSVSPATLLEWDEFSWTDLEVQDTDLNYQVYFATGTGWSLVPNSDLSGNSSGFDISPLDLSGLDVVTYSQLRFKANFSTNVNGSSSALEDWQVVWLASQPTAIPNVAFVSRGEKIIGSDASGDPIYKHSTTSVSGSDGHINLLNMEWDSYWFSINPAGGLDLVDIDPSPQPIGLSPDVNSAVDLYLDSQNSLLVTLQDLVTLEPIFAGSVRLYNGSGYNVTQYTDNEGQTYFIPLTQGNYSLEIQSPGYASTSASSFVTGDVTKIIKLEQIE